MTSGFLQLESTITADMDITDSVDYKISTSSVI
jgi:hypothetical protein